MKLVGNILVGLGLLIATINTIILILTSVTSLEFKHEIHYGAIYLLVILPILIGRGMVNGRKASYFLAVILTHIVGSFAILFFSALFLWNMCVESFSAPVYRHMNDNGKTIVIRDFGCGATDSAPNSKTTYIYDEGIIFYQLTKVDTTTLDRSIWVRVAK